jgi:hypothetical protein
MSACSQSACIDETLLDYCQGMNPTNISGGSSTCRYDVTNHLQEYHFNAQFFEIVSLVVIVVEHEAPPCSRRHLSGSTVASDHVGSVNKEQMKAVFWCFLAGLLRPAGTCWVLTTSGGGQYRDLSRRPGLSRAGSIMSGRLLAAST